MQRAKALRLLREHKPTLSKRYDVSRLALVGSVARDEASEDSDVDIMVWFDGPTTAKHFFGAQLYLEDILGRDVDLMTEKGLREGMHPFEEREMVSV